METDIRTCSDMDFTPWVEDNPLIQCIRNLRDINIKNPEDAYNAIAILEKLKTTFAVLLLELDMPVEEHEKELLLNIYMKNLEALKEYEGTDFTASNETFRLCLRFVQFICFLLYDYYSFLHIEVPEEIRNLV